MEIYAAAVTILMVCALAAALVYRYREQKQLEAPPRTVYQPVDRVVRERVEVPVEKRVEVPVPVEKVVKVPAEEPELPAGAEYLGDPAALPDAPDGVPDSVVDGARFGRLTVRSGSVRGEAARQNATLRRQAVSLAVLEPFGPPVLLSAVAGGRPGAERSQVGAAQACRTVRHRINDVATELDAAWRNGAAHGPAGSARLAGLLGEVMDRVGGPLIEAAQLRNLRLDAVATELTCVLTRLGDGQTREHLAFGVGAGPVLVLRQDGSAVQTLGPDADRPDDTADLLPGAPGRMRWSRFSTSPGELVVVCTRSTVPLLNGRRFGGEVVPRWLAGPPPGLIGFLAQLGSAEPQCRGDRSAVVLWEHGARGL